MKLPAILHDDGPDEMDLRLVRSAKNQRERREKREWEHTYKGHEDGMYPHICQPCELTVTLAARGIQNAMSPLPDERTARLVRRAFA